jgi:hypothetical protein
MQSEAQDRPRASPTFAPGKKKARQQVPGWKSLGEDA